MAGSFAARILNDDRQFKTARLGEAGEQGRIEPHVGQFDVVVRSRWDAVDAQRERLHDGGPAFDPHADLGQLLFGGILDHHFADHRNRILVVRETDVFCDRAGDPDVTLLLRTHDGCVDSTVMVQSNDW